MPTRALSMPPPLTPAPSRSTGTKEKRSGLSEHFRSTSFRLGVAYAVLFFLSVMVILGTIYLSATSEMERIVNLGVASDIGRFNDAFNRHGAEGLREAVIEVTEDSTDDHFFLLLGPDGSAISGNVPPHLWREGRIDQTLDGDLVRSTASLASSAARNPDHEVRFFGTGIRLGDYRVLAAQNAHVLDETQELIISALWWSGLVATLLALVGAFVVSIGPTRRVDAIAAAMRDVAVGRFDLRLPVSRRRDELDRLSGDINGMLERIETLMSSLKQVSSDIAHDLRTPLARLHQKLDRAREDALAKGSDGALIEASMNEVDSIIETFNALLRIAQIEAGARKEKFRQTDVSELLTQLHEVFEGAAEESGHRLAPDLAPGLMIEGDRDLLQQLFANLIENAMTHVPAPATITLTAARVAGRDAGDRSGHGAGHGTGNSHGGIMVSVADDGLGVPDEERDRIFRRLYRLDRSRTTPGNGLGLALVAAIAELHDASLTAIDNHPGLRIQLIFPRSPPDCGKAA